MSAATNEDDSVQLTTEASNAVMRALDRTCCGLDGQIVLSALVTALVTVIRTTYEHAPAEQMAAYCAIQAICEEKIMALSRGTTH